MTEYRLWITIPGLAVDDEDHWEPFIVKLEQEYDLGAMIGWHAGKAEVVVSLPSESEAHATRVAVDAITEALEATGLARLYPSSVAVELVAENELTTA